MAEDIGVDEVEGIDADGDDDHKLEVAVVRVVEAVDAGGGIVGVVGEVGGVVVVDAIEVLVLELCHAGVVVVDEVAHACEGAVDDGDLPSLTVVDLSAAGDEREEEGLVGGMLLRNDNVHGLDGRLHLDLLGSCRIEK